MKAMLYKEPFVQIIFHNISPSYLIIFHHHILSVSPSPFIIFHHHISSPFITFHHLSSHFIICYHHKLHEYWITHVTFFFQKKHLPYSRTRLLVVFDPYLSVEVLKFGVAIRSSTRSSIATVRTCGSCCDNSLKLYLGWEVVGFRSETETKKS